MQLNECNYIDIMLNSISNNEYVRYLLLLIVILLFCIILLVLTFNRTLIDFVRNYDINGHPCFIISYLFYQTIGKPLLRGR